MPKDVIKFSEIDKNDFSLAGNKGVNLGEMVGAGLPVPDGFVITSNAYYSFIKDNKLEIKIKHLLSTADFDNEKSLEKTSTSIKKHIKEGKLSNSLVKEVISLYNKLGNGRIEYLQVTVKPSPTVDILTAESFNARGDAVLLEKIKEAWGSFFNTGALTYRHKQKSNHSEEGLALIIQKTVKADLSGTIFTVDPLTNDKSKIIIEMSKDRYEVNKSDFLIIKKREEGKQNLSTEKIIELAKLGKNLEKHYYFPQEVKWVIESGQIFIIKTNPLTITKTETKLVIDSVLSESDTFLKGDPIYPGIASGAVRLVFSVRDTDKVMPGDVLVVQEISPEFLPALRKTAAVVSDNGFGNPNVANALKNLGIPVVANIKAATETLRTGNIITVNGTRGEVYRGGFAIKQTNTLEKPTETKTATKLYIKLSQAEMAEKIALENIEGGIFEAEDFITKIGIHPKKILKDGKGKEFVDKLSNDLATVCKAFKEKQVFYQALNLKTDQYLRLIGGSEFEPYESNPTLGFRGALRNISDPQVFEMELEAVNIVRTKIGHKNLGLIIPLVRTVKELIIIKEIINKSGINQSSNFKLWMSIETPANVIMLDKFIEIGIDGFLINSDILTMLIMGIDHENFEVTSGLNELNPAVLWAFEHIIKAANKQNITTSIAGLAVSRHPELIRNLVSWGISSVSVQSDAIDNTRKILAQTESELLNRR